MQCLCISFVKCYTHLQFLVYLFLLDGELLCTFSVNNSQQKTVTSVLSAAGVTQLLWPDELQL